MAAKNLISIKQLREDELIDFVNYTFETSDAYLTLLPATGWFDYNKVLKVSDTLLSGVTQVSVSFPPQDSIPVLSFNVNTSGVSDPLLFANISSKSTSGCTVDFTDKTYSSDYYFDLLVSV